MPRRILFAGLLAIGTLVVTHSVAIAQSEANGKGSLQKGLDFLKTLAPPPSPAAESEAGVTASRQKGIDFLKSKQQKDGNWTFKDHDVGVTALCTIALIENGVPLTDPVVQKGAQYVRENSSPLKDTYDIALSVVLLSRIGERRDKSRIKTLAARLIAGQLESGGWSYKCPGPELDPDRVLGNPPQLPPLKEGFGDNSCTQFAVLGLWVASRTGVNIDRTLGRVSKRFIGTQLDDGGWSYTMTPPAPAAGANPPADNAEDKDKPAPKPPSSATMTGAGLFCLAVAEANRIRDFQKKGTVTKVAEKKAATPAKAKAAEKAETKVDDAEPAEPPGKSLLENPVFAKGFKRTGDFVKGLSGTQSRYFMWSVERVGVLLGLEKIGETDWFKAGSSSLLKSQTEEGGWKSSYADPDPDGLTDTAFAILFLRKANLGSDISRLLEGEQEQRFQIIGRPQQTRFNTLEEALAAAKAGETVRIDGDGPWKLTHLELNKDITLQAGFGYAPVFRFEVGVNRLGIKLKPETDVNARDMITVTGGKVTLEGIKFQMDAPVIKQPIPWRAVVVRGGSLRALNCSFSEGTKQGFAGVVLEAPGQLVVRNCLFVGGRAGIEVVTNGKQEVVCDNSVIFSNGGIQVISEEKSPKPADVQLNVVNTTFQVKEVYLFPKVTGKIAVFSHANVYQAEWLGSTLLAAAAGNTTGRSWRGALNLYHVNRWAGANGKAVETIKDVSTWTAFWKDLEKNSIKRVPPFQLAHGMGNFSHDWRAQDWQMEIPEDAELEMIRNQIGVNGYLAGPGIAYDQYRDTIAYTDWMKGNLGLAMLDQSAPVKTGAIERDVAKPQATRIVLGR